MRRCCGIVVCGDVGVGWMRCGMATVLLGMDMLCVV
jgi:hypothetical protein